MKILSAVLFIALTAHLTVSATQRSQRKISEFRTLKKTNQARMGKNRRLVDTAFKNNALIFGVETPKVGNSKQVYNLLEMSIDMERYKHNVKDLSRLILGFKQKMITFRENFEQRIVDLNEMVNHELLGSSSI